VIYQEQNFEEERALYGIKDAQVLDCTFSGPADGESALKECENLLITDCNFQLRYPLWHVDTAVIQHSVMTETCRAALWYDRNIKIERSRLGGIKALRECDNSILLHCDITSTEFGWFCRGVKMEECALISEYPFLQTRDMDVTGLTMKGKYSFQYVENAVIRNSVLDTKDAFWHSKNVTVYDSVIKGEYLAWYSQGLRLVRCKIVGTQPLCYAKGLVLEDCEMEGTDLAFENSEVTATIHGDVLSVKNPIHGSITADSIGKIILDEHRPADADCTIICGKTEK
jgi:hypothetical protein